MSRRFLLLLALLCVTFTPRLASAKKRIVVLGISGPKGEDAARLIASGLSRHFEVISAGRFRRAAGRNNTSTAQGRTIAARTLRVAGIVSGSIVKSQMRWILRLSIFNGQNGQKVGSSSFPLRGSRVDMSTSRRISLSLNRILRHTNPGPPLNGTFRAKPQKPGRTPLPKPQPTPPPAAPNPDEFDDGTEIAPQDNYSSTDSGVEAPSSSDDPKGFSPPPRPSPPAKGDDLGFSEEEEALELDKEVPEFSRRGEIKKRKTVEPKVYREEEESAETSERKPWQTIAELSAGLTVLSRSFDFYNPQIPADPSNYRSGFVPALLLEGAVYPGAIWTKGPLANIGILVEYWRVLSLKSQLPGYTEPLSTTLHDLRLGLRYRWNLLNRKTSLILTMGLGYGRLGFVIHWAAEQNLVPLPNIIYNYLDIAVAKFKLPFYTRRSFALGGLASFSYLFIFSAGDIERTDSSGYGQSFIGGLDFGAGAYAEYSDFSLKLTGFYKHLFFDFDNQCYKTGTGCMVAGGALDRYLGFSLAVGYSY